MARVTVDEIVSTYDMDDSKYHAASNRVVNDTQKMHNSQRALFAMLGASFAGGTELAAGALTALGIAMTGGGLLAAKASIEFDTLTRKLEAVTGSAERAKSVMGFVDQLAIPSVFQSKPLAEAATLLEAFGLKTEQYLPIAEKLATVFSDGESGLNEYVSALGRLKSGQFGEAFEMLRRAGISTEILKSKGLNFDKGGQFLGQAKQALDAVEQIVTQKFGKMASIMQSGPGAKLASVFDLIAKAVRQVGDVMVSSFLPVIEKVSSGFARIVQSGTIQKATEGMSKFFNSKLVSNAILGAISWTLAFFETLPTMIDGVVRKVETLGGAFATMFAMMAGPLGMQAIKGWLAAINDFLGSNGLDKWTFDGASAMIRAQKRIFGELNDDRPWLKNSSLTQGETGVNSPDSTLGRIAVATEKTARNTDMSNQTLGGGALAAYGVNRQELHDLRGASGSHGMKNTARALVLAIEAHFHSMSSNKMPRREV